MHGGDSKTVLWSFEIGTIIENPPKRVRNISVALNLDICVHINNAIY